MLQSILCRCNSIIRSCCSQQFFWMRWLKKQSSVVITKVFIFWLFVLRLIKTAINVYRNKDPECREIDKWIFLQCTRSSAWATNQVGNKQTASILGDTFGSTGQHEQKRTAFLCGCRWTGARSIRSRFRWSRCRSTVLCRVGKLGRDYSNNYM